MTAVTEKILVEKADGIGWLTLNNPARRNAISLEMWQGMGAALDDFEGDPAVRVIVLRGAGGKSFAAGADISQFESQRSSPEQIEAYAKISNEGKNRIGAARKPVIAMIQGYCIGGGVTLALMTDIRIASEDASFGIPAAKLGIAYGLDSLTKLAALVGPAVAKEMLFTGRRIGAQDAFRIGLLNRVVAAEGLEPMVRDFALEISRNAPLTIRSAKIGIDQLMLDPHERDVELVQSSARACVESQDYAIGRRAFMEKRTPEFIGR